MSARRFADTNVLVYLFDADPPAKRERARQILATDSVEGRLVISTQVLLTEDLQDGWEVGGVRVENPFRGL